MAEYYPLLSRAVATLRDAPAEKRRAIYDRARGALLGQLRSMQPPVPAEAIDREARALDDAIARLEAEMPGAKTAPPEPAVTPPPPPPVEAIERRDEPAAAPAPPLPVAPAPPPPDAELAPPAVAEPPPPALVPSPPPAVEPAPAPVEPVAPPVPPPTASPPIAADRGDVPAVPVPPILPPDVASRADGPSSAPALVIDPLPPPPTAPLLRSRPPGAPRPLTAPPRATGARPAAEALTRIIAADQGPDSPVIRASRDEDGARPRAASVTRVSAALPSAPKLQVQTFADAVVAAGEAAAEAQGREGSEAGETTLARDEGIRPAAPRPVVREPFNPRVLILALIGALVVAGIAYTAWRLRDKPETLARSRAALAAAEQASSQQSGKISNRADGGAVPVITAPTTPSATASPPAASSPAVAGPAAATVAPAADAANPAPQAATPDASATLPAPAATPTPEAASSAPVTPAPATDAAGIAVAQRAAFLIDAPDEPSKIKTYVGTVVWRTENVTPGQNQALAQAVRADIEIPDAALKLTMLFQKNFEPQFPASHTLDLRFTPGQNAAIGNVKQINVPQMRKDDSPSGDSLVGLPVTITENYFLVGLSRGDAMARNLDLIKTRNWFDIPVLLTSGKVAKITFEKGSAGQQIVDNVIQGWQ